MVRTDYEKQRKRENRKYIRENKRMLGQLKINEIHLGDAFDLIKKIPDKSIDLLLTDPPYNISRTDREGLSIGDRTGHNFGEWDYGFDTDTWLELVIPKLKENSQIIMFHNFTYYEKVVRRLEEEGFEVHLCSPYWYKPNPIPGKRKRLPTSTVEGMMWLTRGEYTFNGEDKSPAYSYSSSSRKRFHTTQKPLDLFRDIITTHTNKGDIVLDTFGGSGVTSVACEDLDRYHITFEKDPKYHKKSKARLDKIKSAPKTLWI